MNVLFSILSADILPIFLIAGAGYLLAKHVGTSVKTLSHVVFYALLPCLVFRMLVTSQKSGQEFGRMALLSALMILAMGAVAYLVAVMLRLGRVDLRAFVLVVMFSNCGNYGLPVVRFAFGPEALAYATVFFLTGSVLTYTVGGFIAAGAHGSARTALSRVARMPAVYGVLLAGLVLASGRPVPDAVMRPVQLLSDAALPVMILILGMQLERAARPKRFAIAALAVAVSLLVAPFVALGLTWLLGVTGPARQAAVTLSSMPVAVTTTILALEFDLSPDFVTGAVFLSTILSPFTLTPLIAYLQ
jgi:malate permease and related proteins